MRITVKFFAILRERAGVAETALELPAGTTVAAAGAACLVLEPDKTILLEKPKVLELADRYKIAIVGYDGAAQQPPA